MEASTITDQKKAQRLLGRYNLIPNFAWSILNLAPLGVFCYTLMDPWIFSIVLAVSFIPAFFRNSVFDKFQIGTSTRIYKKLGVPAINKFTQNGVIINALIRRKFPEYKMVSPDRASISKLIGQTYAFEKFHTMMFVFFTLTAFYAAAHSYPVWTATILLTNVIFNIYPSLLQQYIRLKLILFSKKGNISF